MLTPDQITRLLLRPSTLLIFDGFNPASPTLHGPYQCVGDCISEDRRFSAAMIDTLSIRLGDLGLWFMPSLEPGEQYACKWFVADSAGRTWLACKYFAVRHCPDFHYAAGRVVAIIEGERGTFDEPLASRLASEMAGLRANPPRRDDVVVFREDLLDLNDIVAELDRRHQLS
jgi:hypothetical protein